ncbi:MAG: hypothetical protein H0X66_07515 [Verrucomicrobia bacterium]|nr:hypothetical protein [Verrucomicrobiota bacterium]
MKPGPWGDLECIRISIEIPTDLLTVADYTEPVEWLFKDHSREAVMEVFRKADLSPEQFREVSLDRYWSKTEAGYIVRPTFDLIVGLQPEARSVIYNLLGRFPENRAHYSSFLLRQNQIDELNIESGLSEEIIALFKKLIYGEGDLLVFNDASTILSTLPDEQKQLQFLKLISRRSTFLMKLKINQDSDIEKLVSYWGGGRRAKDIRPLLESLQRVPGGCAIDVAHLVPFFARKRMYTYPMPERGSSATRENCHWSALNFFNDPPDTRMLDPDRVEGELKKNYRKISGNPQMGDLVLFRQQNGEVVHSATYIAEDVLFTKNGEGVYQPWLLMNATDVIGIYRNLHGEISASLYRHRDWD